MNELNISKSGETGEKDKRRRSLVKLGIITALAFIVWIFATIAWFAMNKSVTAGGMTVTTATIPFEIATTGTLIRNQSGLEEARPGYTQGFSSGAYHTSQDTDSLMLRFTPNEDDPATEDVDESEVLDIGPNSCGELNLYIIPKRDGDIDAYITLDVISFKAVTANNEERLIEVNEDLITDPDLTSDQIADCQEAAGYLRGHIMFFQGLSQSPSQYSYVTPVIDGTIHFHQSNAETGTAYRVPIYWTWPNTLGQIASKTGALRDGTPVVEETSSATKPNGDPTDKALVLTYLKDNKDSVFKDLDSMTSIKSDLIASLSVEDKAEYDALETSEEKDAYLESHADYGSCIENAIDNADMSRYFDYLSDGYNTADFSIGTNLDYFLIEVTVASEE